MPTSVFSRRRRSLGSLLVGLSVVAGTLGNVALAKPVSASASVDANVMVQAGLSPADAAKAAQQLNSAIDAAARSLANAAAGAFPSGAPVRSTAATLAQFTNDVDKALTAFVVTSVPAIRATGAAAGTAVAGTLGAVNQLAQSLPGLVQAASGATVKIAASTNGGSTSVSIDATVDPAVRQLISNLVHGLQPLLPITAATVRAVATGVHKVVDALGVAVSQVIKATVDAAIAVVGSVRTVTQDALQATRNLAASAAATTQALVTAVDATLDGLRSGDMNISAQVDATLKVSAG
jgi:hypothetical protein